MPEGPEIRRAADQLSSVLCGHPLTRVYFFSEKLKTFEKILKGSTVEKVRARGKALLTSLDSGYTIYSHNQLYGRWQIVEAGKHPKTKRSLRMALETQSHRALLFSASDINVLKSEVLADHPFLAKIGPDILESDLTWRIISKRLMSNRFKNRQLASLFLDQSFLAGIGNYLRSEILFDARVNPLKKPKELSRTHNNQISRSTLKICRRAYAQNGVTNPESLVRKLKILGIPRSGYRHAVFGRIGKLCHACKTPIEKITIASRRLYVCPRCQNVN